MSTRGKVVTSRGYRPLMTEQTFDKPCLDCRANVTFPVPGDVTCEACGAKLFATASGLIGRYPREDWEPGRIQGYRRPG
jgi:hypothetical protein